MHSDFPPVDALFVSKNPVHFNLGSVGAIESRQNEGTATETSSVTRYGCIVESNLGLPKPGRDMVGQVLRIPGGMPLAVVATVHWAVAYYAIFDLSQQSARRALGAALKTGRLEMEFGGSKPQQSGVCLDAEQRKRLQMQLVAGATGIVNGRSWRDQFGLLLLSLPALLAESDWQASMCVHHSAVLFAGKAR